MFQPGFGSFFWDAADASTAHARTSASDLFNIFESSAIYERIRCSIVLS